MIKFGIVFRPPDDDLEKWITSKPEQQKQLTKIELQSSLLTGQETFKLFDLQIRFVFAAAAAAR